VGDLRRLPRVVQLRRHLPVPAHRGPRGRAVDARHLSGRTVVGDHLYVDERADAGQREAIARILTGEEGGTPDRQFPWVFKESRLLGWRPAPIEIDRTPRRGWFRAGDQVTVRIREPVADQETVTCVIPGHDRDGIELYADLLRVDEGPLSFELSGSCAYQSTFAYASDG
jgi:hypothetical protein